MSLYLTGLLIWLKTLAEAAVQRAQRTQLIVYVRQFSRYLITITFNIKIPPDGREAILK